MFEDQKDTIEASTSLVSNVVDKDTQEKIDIVKGRLIRDYGYDEESATDVLQYVASIFARGDAKQPAMNLECGVRSAERRRRDMTSERSKARMQIGIAVVLSVCFYIGSYLTLRWQHVLIRTNPPLQFAREQRTLRGFSNS